MNKQSTINNIIIAIFSLTLLISCSENVSYDENAIKLTIQEIIDTPTNSWFKTEMNNYKPDTNIIREIINNFDSNKHKVYLYANFSCGCSNQQTDISHLCKVFKECNIPESSYEIYSMRSSTGKHPYKSRFSISELPECIVMKDTNAVYFMLDTMREHKLYAEIIPVEQLLLNGLKK
ncbi:MAG: hypothetical protein M1419_03785 [Bacteroidetes bacterium]|nr:hypothetical protein [Bacteroidota bacterium]